MSGEDGLGEVGSKITMARRVVGLGLGGVGQETFHTYVAMRASLFSWRFIQATPTKVLMALPRQSECRTRCGVTRLTEK